METVKKVLSAIWTGIKCITKAIKLLLWPLRKAYDWVTEKLSFVKTVRVSKTSYLLFTGSPSCFFFIPVFHIKTSYLARCTTKSYRISFLIFQAMLDVDSAAPAVTPTEAVDGPGVASAIPTVHFTLKDKGNTYTIKKAPVVKKAAVPKVAAKKTAPKATAKVVAKKTVAKKK